MQVINGNGSREKAIRVTREEAPRPVIGSGESFLRSGGAGRREPCSRRGNEADRNYFSLPLWLAAGAAGFRLAGAAGRPRPAWGSRATRLPFIRRRSSRARVPATRGSFCHASRPDSLLRPVLTPFSPHGRLRSAFLAHFRRRFRFFPLPPSAFCFLRSTLSLLRSASRPSLLPLEPPAPVVGVSSCGPNSASYQ